MNTRVHSATSDVFASSYRVHYLGVARNVIARAPSEMLPPPALPIRRHVLPRLNDRVALADGALSVSPFCLGVCGSERTVEAAFDAGMNFFFVGADMHWPKYEHTRRGIARLVERGRRDEIVVAGVAYVSRADFCVDPFRELIDAIPGLERLDITIAGTLDEQELSPSHGGRLAVYREHRVAASEVPGVRATGATFHDRRAAKRAICEAMIDIAFSRYNADRWMAERDLFPAVFPPTSVPLFAFKSTWPHISAARMREIGVPPQCWVPDVTDHYRFALTPIAVQGLLLSLDHENHVRDLTDAIARGPLSEEERQYMKDLSEIDRGIATIAA